MKKIWAVAVVLLVLSNVFVFASVSANEYKKAFEQKQNLRTAEEQKAYAAVMNERLNHSGVPVAYSSSVMITGGGLFVNPINGGIITSRTGSRNIGDGIEHHKGLDISSPSGTPIIAAADGIVTYSGVMGTYGNVIIIKHAGVYTTVYAHQSRLLAVLGQSVEQGQVIGLVGSTGRSTGSHLHFEIHEGDWNSGRTNYVNPLKYISM